MTGLSNKFVMKLQESPFGRKKDSDFMHKALLQAQRAYAADEVPVGAILVDVDGTIIGRGYNQVEKQHTQAAHAEVIAISKAGKKMGDWRLNGCWLYVTLEPCSMCIYLALLSRLEGVVFGASSPLFGYQLDKTLTFQLYKNNALSIVAGVSAEKAAQLLRNFFRLKRGEMHRDDKERKLNKRDW
jgi:tRNA(adenine34) deaminase